ncbi:MAG TPA: DNA/RNA helicase domain-containing protein, partial [Gemmataceae bacterium]|nr:DNA/RNA helicase domain-containing protein [Gemmataceae bacterium]
MPDPSHVPEVLSRAWYGASIAEFLLTDSATIVGRLVTNCDFPVLPSQRDAWLEQIRLLQSQLVGLTGSIFLEFNIPRMGRRIDTVLLIKQIIFVVEFKVGDIAFDRAALDQVWDYALDLKNFHQASHSALIIPILLATGAATSPAVELRADPDNVYRPLSVRSPNFRATLDCALQTVSGEALDEKNWPHAPYHPTPTIVEAARALYAQHSVEAIARYDAGAQNLRVTSRRIEELLDEARARKRKLICFVTGVPGAGKTLVGLNVATQRRDVEQPTHAVFLSGNGPLVDVLHEALTRDEVVRRRKAGIKVRKGKVGESVKAFIQNVHHFRDDLLSHAGAPIEHVAIFDEAQRAWNLRKTADFMQRRKKRPGFAHSEPEFLISCMDRHADWAVIVCLVGGGQEIHDGEAGIDAWIDAVNARFPHWHMFISSRLTDSEYGAGRALEAVRRGQHAEFDDCLHLAVSMRSFRAENVSYFVKALLDCEKGDARQAYAQLADRYPLVVTRDLHRAKQWIRDHARGSERYGLVASSKAHRLKPDAIDIRVDVDPVHWFLNDKQDTRSSFYLEDAATEFQVQGLELDWACVAWDGDLRFSGAGWNYHAFSGDRWRNVAKL